MTPLLGDKLRCLRAREGFAFKLYLLVYKAITIISGFVRVCYSCFHPLRFSLCSSWRPVFVSRTRRRLGNRAFCFDGPMSWNSVLPDIQTAPSLTTFNKLRKSHSIRSIILCNLISSVIFCTMALTLWTYYDILQIVVSLLLLLLLINKIINYR